MEVTIAARAEEDLQIRLGEAAEKVGLNPSDLVRVGIVRVIQEVEGTGSLRIVKLGSKGRKSKFRP